MKKVPDNFYHETAVKSIPYLEHGWKMSAVASLYNANKYFLAHALRQHMGDLEYLKLIRKSLIYRREH